MSTSSRFAVAVHTLTLLAMDGSKHVTSGCIAGSVNTHPVFIRRILGLLRRAGLVTSQPGAGGGATLARPPEQIALLEVYRAVEGGSLLSLSHHSPNAECPCGRNIREVLREVFGRAETAMENELSDITVADVLHQVVADAYKSQAGTHEQGCLPKSQQSAETRC